MIRTFLSFSAPTTLVVASLVIAQTPALAEPSGDDPAALDAVMQSHVELTMIEKKLNENAEKALARPKVATEQARIQEWMLSEMRKIEPRTQELIDTLQGLEPKILAANEGTDEHRDLMTQAVFTMNQLQMVEERIKQTPEFKAEEAKMMELIYAELGEMDPELKALVDRRAELKAIQTEGSQEG
ncbi:MAG: hypothetical protein EA397_00395 [Deltaproteobacteria bacterium]|nr:MAG: hypothetical protein EA397_00395 [Deltaproteobacteria bacterium]